ncbi:Beta-glucosidase [Quillaja saponaria]|uniref:Beta-glucosidase n=1 Tax=Quillaja saponaria TaxID=32244 RepID=A0AAD7L0H8_QUISA|nr:Beta-glucosidase [Quillaja saponaria]
MNWDAYRFSISWSRILPKGKLSGGVNIEGIQYYNNLINELIANDQQPFVTLFHWDVPQALEDEYGGFLSPEILHHRRLWRPGITTSTCSLFRLAKSQLHGRRFRHRAIFGVAQSTSCSCSWCEGFQGGLIGIKLVSHWYEPLTSDKLDRDAQGRALDFMFGWFMEPLTNGDYPQTMRSLVGNRLPKFSKEQSKLINQSFDFLGLNYYTTYYVSNAPYLRNDSQPSIQTDSIAKLSTQRDGMDIGPRFGADWLYVYPRGFRDLLLYTKTKYNNPIIYITENGIAEKNDPSLSLEEALMDTYRIDFCYRHLYYLQNAIKQQLGDLCGAFIQVRGAS